MLLYIRKLVFLSCASVLQLISRSKRLTCIELVVAKSSSTSFTFTTSCHMLVSYINKPAQPFYSLTCSLIYSMILVQNKYVKLTDSCTTKHWQNEHRDWHVGGILRELLTSVMSSTDIAPGRSCLFANTSKVAPANLYIQQSRSHTDTAHKTWELETFWLLFSLVNW